MQFTMLCVCHADAGVIDSQACATPCHVWRAYAVKPRQSTAEGGVPLARMHCWSSRGATLSPPSSPPRWAVRRLVAAVVAPPPSVALPCPAVNVRSPALAGRQATHCCSGRAAGRAGYGPQAAAVADVCTTKLPPKRDGRCVRRPRVWCYVSAVRLRCHHVGRHVPQGCT